MKEIDLSIKDEYYSQVNNKYFPFEACMPTSFTMALMYNGIQVMEAGASTVDVTRPYIIYPKGVSPDDYLMAMLRSPVGLGLRDSIPWAKAANTEPNEVHDVISQMVNMLAGKQITKMISDSNIDGLTMEIKSGHSVMTSGSFVKGGGHAVCVCGLRYDENTGNVTDFLVDDPYGNYFTDYKDHNGNNVWWPLDTFKKLWRGVYHIVRKEGV